MQFLQQPGLDLRRQHHLAGVLARNREWHFHVDKGHCRQLHRHEAFPRDRGHQVENILIKHIPRANLLFDHIEPGAFDVHADSVRQGG